MINFAPGHTFGPFFTSFVILSKFNAVTYSGIVKFKAMDLGIPI
jgi:hypothetical protein